jgi:hypothetical protein
VAAENAGLVYTELYYLWGFRNKERNHFTPGKMGCKDRNKIIKNKEGRQKTEDRGLASSRTHQLASYLMSVTVPNALPCPLPMSDPSHTVPSEKIAFIIQRYVP